MDVWLLLFLKRQGYTAQEEWQAWQAGWYNKYLLDEQIKNLLVLGVLLVKHIVYDTYKILRSFPKFTFT